MTELIVPEPPDPGNSPNDLICPIAGCRARCSFSSARFQVWCPTCGWQHDLTSSQHAELVDALLGISDLPLAQYLLILATQCVGALGDHQTPLAVAPVYRVEGGVR